MNSLNNRQIKFINLLIVENEYKTISYFADFLKTSCKTLQKDLKIIEKYLGSFNVLLNRKRGVGIKIINVKTARWLLVNDLKFQRTKCKKITTNERRLEIARNMLLDSDTATSIQKLSDIYYVSKTSIVADINYIEKWFSKFNLKLKKSVKGTILVGSEINIRRTLSMLMIEYSKLDYKTDDIFKNISSRINPSTFNALAEIFDEDKIIYVNNYLMKLEKKYNCCINDPYYINLLTHILISLTRGIAGMQINSDFIKDDYDLKSQISYKVALNMVTTMNRDFKVSLGESEVYYLYEYFASCGLIKNVEENSSLILDKLNYKAKIFTENMSKYVEKIMGINICNDKKIMKDVFLHVRPMLNRLKNNIKITNPLLEDIEKECSDTLEVCKLAVLFTLHDLCRVNYNFIPVDEIGYLTVYYETAIERMPVKKKVILVCQSGFGTSQLLMTKIKKTFFEWEISDVVPAYALKDYNLNNIDLVISTVPICHIRKPYIIVSAFLSEEDVINISNMLSYDNRPKSLRNVQAGLNYINKYISKENVYFNKTDDEVFYDINKKYSCEIKFNDISFGEKIKIKLAFTHGLNLLINFKNTLSLKEHMTVYIMADDTKIISEVMSTIYYFYKANYTIKEIVMFINKCKYGIKCDEFKNDKDNLKLDDIKKIISKDTINLEMNVKNKLEAITQLSYVMKKYGIISDVDKFLDDINQRESLGVTGIGGGIAIPHIRSSFVNRTTIAIGRSKNPIQWESLDNEPVYVVILFAVRKDNEIDDNIKIVSKIAGMLGDDDVCKRLLLAQKPDNIYKIFLK